MHIWEQKRFVRRKFKKIRDNLESSYKQSACSKILDITAHFIEKITTTKAVGLYWPIGSEVDVLPLLDVLYKKKVKCALPTLSKNSEIEFKQWSPFVKMYLNKKFNILEPIDTAVSLPNIIITPVITCDIDKNRIGYGKGYYDKYFTKHKQSKKLISIALCYDSQLSMRLLPHEEHDQKVSFIVTEKGIIK